MAAAPPRTPRSDVTGSRDGGPRALAISSRVAYGRVGLSAIEAVFAALGVELVAVPTVTLSNHPGLGAPAGLTTPPDTILEMVEALARIGALEGLQTVLTGYLPSAAHVAAASEAVDVARRAAGDRILSICDPVLGDDPGGLYIAEDAARAVRDSLVPRADLLTPNAFELGWLTGARIGDLRRAEASARGLGPSVIVTSPPLPSGRAGVLATSRSADADLITTDAVAGAPKGTGDAFAGLIAAGVSPRAAVEAMSRMIAESAGSPYLRISEAAGVWTPSAKEDRWRSTSS